MITAAGTMKPLPVRPTEPVGARMLAPLPQLRAAQTMHPLPVPTPEPVDMVDAIRTAAYQRMLERHGVQA
ncbi:MAG: hypothetical protein KDC46_01385 [Thermoleophilia bacterium]|nr:hypothetical protein [Thermoleophilia bacterium]